MNVIAIVSAKGGVGKTTLTANLGSALNNGRRVVCLDLDPQNVLRLHLGVAVNEIDGIARCTLEDRPWNTAIFQSPGNPEILPFSAINEFDRKTFETHLNKNDKWLSKGIESLNLKKDDFLLIDTPPGPSLYLQHALRVANFVLIVLQPDAATYVTIPAMESLVSHYCENSTEFFGSACILNGVNSDKVLTRDIVDLLRSNLGHRLIPTIIHQDEAVRESLASDQLLATYDPHCEATFDIENCAQWIIEKMSSIHRARISKVDR